MVCIHCSTQNPETATFCQRCGKQLATKSDDQASYPSPPPTGTPSLNVLAQPKKGGYVVAGIAALVALFAFSYLPYATFFYNDGYNYGPHNLIAVAYDKYTALSGLLTLVTLIIAALLIFRKNPFGLAKTPIVTQVRRGIYAMIGMSGLSILIQMYEAIDLYKFNASLYGLEPDSTLDIGFWLYLLAMGAIIAGSIMALSMLSSSLPPQSLQGQQPPIETEINQDRKPEQYPRQAGDRVKREEAQRRNDELAALGKELATLYTQPNQQKRAKTLEGVLNRLFAVSDMHIRDAFTLTGAEGERFVEQIDGLVEIDRLLYLVETKWGRDRVGPGEVSQHIVRIYGQAELQGIFISAWGYTDAAVEVCKTALRDKIIVLCELKEIVLLLERRKDLGAFLRAKIRAAIVDKNPLFFPE